MTFHTKHSKSEKTLRICFDKIDEFIKIHDKIIWFFDSYCDKLFDKIKYLKSE